MDEDKGKKSPLSDMFGHSPAQVIEAEKKAAGFLSSLKERFSGTDNNSAAKQLTGFFPDNIFADVMREEIPLPNITLPPEEPEERRFERRLTLMVCGLIMREISQLRFPQEAESFRKFTERYSLLLVQQFGFEGLCIMREQEILAHLQKSRNLLKTTRRLMKELYYLNAETLCVVGVSSINSIFEECRGTENLTSRTEDHNVLKPPRLRKGRILKKK
ncbi:MAG: hypothetical protein ACOYK8_10450 [Alphaproteobacteria bacterium]